MQILNFFLMPETIQSLNLPGKSVIFPSRCLYILFTLILSEDKKLFLQIEFSVPILFMVLFRNQENNRKC